MPVDARLQNRSSGKTHQNKWMQRVNSIILELRVKQDELTENGKSGLHTNSGVPPEVTEIFTKVCLAVWLSGMPGRAKMQP